MEVCAYTQNPSIVAARRTIANGCTRKRARRAESIAVKTKVGRRDPSFFSC
uniref:Uncharacterized protein n=1 Tax=Rhizophora mucronata TaxID=61149 RepID=A0A2P2LGL2_RHIMU